MEEGLAYPYEAEEQPIELTPQQKEEVIREYIEFVKTFNPYEKELIGDMMLFLGMYRESIDPTPEK